MSNKMSKQELLDIYTRQTANLMRKYGPQYYTLHQNSGGYDLFAPLDDSPFTNSQMMKHGIGLGTSNEIQVPFSTGGLFADPCLEGSVINLITTPQRSIANLIPVRPNNNTIMRYAYMTGDLDLDGVFPDGKCEPGPQPQSQTACYAEFRKGRVSASSRTIEIDELLENACLGVDPSRFYLLGSQRGVSAPFRPFSADDRVGIFRSAILNEMRKVGLGLQKDLLRQFWVGDPTDVARNTTNGGRSEFWGLLNMIVDDYGGGKDWVSGTTANCNLNADVKDFNACIGALNSGGYSLYQLLEEVAFELQQRASLYGHGSVDWVIVMRNEAFQKLVESLPCEWQSFGCNTTDTNVQLVANDGNMRMMQNELKRTQTLVLNNTTWNVVLDDWLPVQTTIDGGTGAATYTSDIVFLPLRVDNEDTIFWTHKDYRSLEGELQGLPMSIADEVRGWTDGGRFHTVSQRDFRCLLVDTKIEAGLSFLAPHLSGRITNVDACFMQAHTVGQGSALPA